MANQRCETHQQLRAKWLATEEVKNNTPKVVSKSTTPPPVEKVETPEVKEEKPALKKPSKKTEE